MTKDFIPAKDSDLVVWAQNYSTRISAAPTSMGLVVPQATALAGVVSTYVTANEAATNPSTRTRGTISARNDAKLPMVAMARDLARIINAFPGTTNQMRIDLGLNPRSGTFTPVPVPTESPVMKVSLSNDGRVLKIRLSGQDTARRGKPANCSGASVFSYVALNGTPPADISQWKFEGSTTRTIFDLEVPPTVPGGSQIFLTAFWFNTKSQSSPACSPVSAFVGGGVNNAIAPQMKLAA